VIPTVGRSSLLPVAVERAAATGGTVVVVVDGDPGPGWSPPAGVTVVRTGASLGYGGACNLGAGAVGGELLLFLNDDVLVGPDLLHHLEGQLADPGVGAVTPDVWSVRLGRSEAGCTVRWRRGLLDTAQGPLRTTGQVGYPCGAAVALRRAVFEGLGGFDTLYAPGYWEDVDLGLTLARLGLATVAVAEARVEHRHGASFPAPGSPPVRRLYERNRLLASVKFAPAGAVPGVLAVAAARAARHALRDRPAASGAAAAMRRLGPALGARRRLRRLIRGWGGVG